MNKKFLIKKIFNCVKLGNLDLPNDITNIKKSIITLLLSYLSRVFKCVTNKTLKQYDVIMGYLIYQW